MPDDIYKNINVKPDPANADRIEDRNTYPDQVSTEKDISFPADKLISRVDYFQEHPHGVEFNDTNGLFSFYDPTNPDRQYFDCIEQEAISLSSPPIKYYRLQHLRNQIDPVYGEAIRRDGYADPVIIYGNYEDSSFDQGLTKFGINQEETLDIWFNLNYLLNKIGDFIQKGDIIETYDAKLWEVMTTLIIDESLWRAQHNNVKVIRVQPQGIFLPDYDGTVKSSIHELPNIPCDVQEEYEIESKKESDIFKQKLLKLRQKRVEGS